MDNYVLIDPHIFLVPDPCFNKVDFEHYVENILAWQDENTEELDDERERLRYTAIPMDLLSQLILDREYPFPQKIKEYIKHFGIQHFDHETVVKIIQNLLDNSMFTEDRLKVVEVCCTQSATHITPNEYLNELKTEHSIIIEETWIKIGFENSVGLSGYEKVFWGTDRLFNKMNKLNVKSEIEIFEPDFDKEISLPLKFNIDFPIIVNYSEYLCQQNHMKLWSDAKNKSKAMMAVESYVQKEINRCSSLKSSRKDYSFGKYFLDTAQKWKCTETGGFGNVLVATCGDIILDKNNKKTSPFRFDKKKTAEQRINKSGGMYFRVHLTKSGVGLRLIFLKYDDGRIVFTNVGDKDELRDLEE